jgi:hypothetical protein
METSVLALLDRTLQGRLDDHLFCGLYLQRSVWHSNIGSRAKQISLILIPFQQAPRANTQTA